MKAKEIKVLHLTLKKKWFDMILSGEKKEEYREIKDYWLKRLTDFFETITPMTPNFKHFDVIRFRNGYANNAPTIEIECLGMFYGICRTEWSDNAQGTHIVIKLGNILSTSNLTATELNIEL